MPIDMVKENNFKIICGSFARVSQERFKGMLYHFCGLWKSLQFHKMDRDQCRMHLLWVFLLSRSWGFQPWRRFHKCQNPSLMVMKKLTLYPTQTVQPNRKWSSPPTSSMWQGWAKDEASLTTPHLHHLTPSLLLHFSNNGNNT